MSRVFEGILTSNIFLLGAPICPFEPPIGYPPSLPLPLGRFWEGLGGPSQASGRLSVLKGVKGIWHQKKVVAPGVGRGG